MAEGPMSTPRRDWPRSSGTPMMRMCLVSMFCSGLVMGLVAIAFLVESYIVRLSLEEAEVISPARKRWVIAMIMLASPFRGGTFRAGATAEAAREFLMVAVTHRFRGGLITFAPAALLRPRIVRLWRSCTIRQTPGNSRSLALSCAAAEAARISL